MKTLATFFLLAGGLFANSPDCSIAFNLTAAGRYPVAGYNSGALQTGCVVWYLSYYSTGFTALSLELDSADDNLGVAAAWGAFAGTALTANGCGTTNPLTGITHGCYLVAGANPWVSVNLQSVTGTGNVVGVAFGCRPDHCASLVAVMSSGGGGGGGGSVGPSASAYSLASQSLSAGTNTALSFDTNQWDTCTCIHSTAVNPTRFVAPSAGYYQMTCVVQIGNVNTQLAVSVSINGPPAAPALQNSEPSSTYNASSVSGIIKLNAGDYAQCNAYVNSAVNTLGSTAIGQLTKLM